MSASELQWFKNLPDDWESMPLRYAVEHINIKNENPTASYLSLMANIGIIPYEKKGNVGNKAPEDLTRCKIVTPGDFVINSMNYQIGSYGRSVYSGVCSPVYIVLRSLIDRVDPRFIYRMLQVPAFQKHAQTFGNGILEHRKSISWDTLKNQPMPIPTLDAQRAIADYLDRETDEIDAFIADQEELIALLAERRTATITRAVAKGLNPNTPMRDSGVGWLGTVPQHWSPLKISRLTPVQESGVSVNGYREPASEGETGVLKTGASSKGYFDPNENKKVADEDLTRVACPLREGWLLINRANTPDLVGSAAFVTNAPRGLYLSDKLWQIDFTDADNKFMYWWMSSIVCKTQLQFHRVGASTSMQNLSYSDFKSLDVAVPPSDEQREIADYLDRETTEIDAAIADAREAIALSQERRSAVISAAVTGKIDVRGLVAPEAKEVEDVSVGAA